MNSLLDYALGLATGPNHYKVFPCAADKQPLTKHGYHDASSEPAIIRTLPWARARLIGIACAPSGVLAVDLDEKDGRHGLASFDNLVQAFEPTQAVQVGPAQNTKNNGRHLLFKHPEIKISQSNDSIADGLDIRSNGHVCTGPGYEWLEAHGPHTALLLPPAWFVDLIIATRDKPKPEIEPAGLGARVYTSNADKWLNNALSMAGVGTRNKTGFWLACQLRDDGLSQSDALSVRYPEGVPQKTGNEYTRRDWTKSVESAYSKAPRPPARNLNSSALGHSAPPPAAAAVTSRPPSVREYLPPEPEAPPWESEIPFTTIPELSAAETPTVTKTERPRYVVRSAADALTPREPIAYLVDDIISCGSVNVLVGKFGSKKTWATLSAAVCVALGKPWVGYETHQCTTLIVDEESGEDRLSRRLGMAIRGELGGPDTPVLYVSLAQFNLFKNPNDAIILQALIEETGAGAVWIDALADIMAGGDENSVKDTQPVFMQLRKIAETTKAAITVVHHTNKLGDYRGSSAIPGAIDTMILVDSEEGSEFINFKTLKNRDGEPLSWSGKANWNEDQFWMGEAQNQGKKERVNLSQAYVLRVLADGEKTMDEIKNGADTCSPGAARHAVYDLAAAGKIHRTNSGGQGAPGIYALTNKSEVVPE